MKLQGFIGPAYQLKSVNVDAQRCVNLFPEVVESGSGKGGQVAYLKKTPGLTELFTVGTGPIRMIHVENFERDNPVEKAVIYVVSGSQVFACSYQYGAWSTKLCGSISTSSGPVSAHSIKKATSPKYQTVFVDGDNNYLAKSNDYDGGCFVVSGFGTFSSFSLTPVLGATQITWIDGYLVLISKFSNEFNVSEWSGTAFAALDFATSEGNPDNIVGMASLNRDLILFNTVSTEIFTNTGNPDFPFQRVQSGYIEMGCVAQFSVEKIAGTMFWLSRDESGQGVVLAASGPSPQRISTHAIEYAISTYADISSARAYTYQSQGHSFYVLNFEEATWVYDLSTKMWHERAYLNNGVLERHRADTHGFLPSLGIQIVGDYENNKIYKLDDNINTDAGNPIKRLRATPHLSNELKRVFFSSLQIDMETGIGLDGVQQGEDPVLMLRYSDDGGHSWSEELQAAIGRLGNYKTRVIWRRLGASRDRIFEVSMTDPINATFIDAEIEVVAGGS